MRDDRWKCPVRQCRGTVADPCEHRIAALHALNGTFQRLRTGRPTNDNEVEQWPA